ncbi:MAG: iron-sulfur cluster assembly accessory protein [Bryobacteraceae bacterium]
MSETAQIEGQAEAGQSPAAKQVFVTPRAVEKIRQAFAREKVSGGLRLGVLGGGCSGLSYQFKFAQQPRSTDHVFHFEDVQVFVDPKSMVFLDGMTLDWKDALLQSGFVFHNPHATKSCGCGTSFSS